MLSYRILPARTAVIQGRSGRLIQRAYACLTALCLVLFTMCCTVTVCIKFSLPFCSRPSDWKSCFWLRQNCPFNLYVFGLYLEWWVSWKIQWPTEGHLDQTHGPWVKSKLCLFLWAGPRRILSYSSYNCTKAVSGVRHSISLVKNVQSILSSILSLLALLTQHAASSQAKQDANRTLLQPR